MALGNASAALQQLLWGWQLWQGPRAKQRLLSLLRSDVRRTFAFSLTCLRYKSAARILLGDLLKLEVDS